MARRHPSVLPGSRALIPNLAGGRSAIGARCCRPGVGPYQPNDIGREFFPRIHRGHRRLLDQLVHAHVADPSPGEQLLGDRENPLPRPWAGRGRALRACAGFPRAHHSRQRRRTRRSRALSTRRPDGPILRGDDASNRGSRAEFRKSHTAQFLTSAARTEQGRGHVCSAGEGLMFWFDWKTLWGSYLALIWVRRS